MYPALIGWVVPKPFRIWWQRKRILPLPEMEPQVHSPQPVTLPTENHKFLMQHQRRNWREHDGTNSSDRISKIILSLQPRGISK
jgi:hypothetical protein